MKSTLEDMAQRGHNFAIVDEVDSILVDEARTPLIISGPSQDRSELYTQVDKLIPLLDETHYKLDEKTRNVTYSEDGNEFIEHCLLYTSAFAFQSFLAISSPCLLAYLSNRVVSFSTAGSRASPGFSILAASVTSFTLASTACCCSSCVSSSRTSSNVGLAAARVSDCLFYTSRCV